MTTTVRGIMIAGLIAGAATTAMAQGGGGRGGRGVGGAGTPPAGASSGLLALSCAQCTVHVTGATMWVEYGAEPTITALARSDGPLHVGDVLVAVDGALITTRSGGERLSHLTPGRQVELTVRRDGRQLDVAVTPTDPERRIAGSLTFRGDSIKVVWRPDSATFWRRDSSAFRMIVPRLRQALQPRVCADSIGNGALRIRRIGCDSTLRGWIRVDSGSAGSSRVTGFRIGTFGFSDQPIYSTGRGAQWSLVRADTLSNGTVRTIWNDGRDTNFALRAGRGATFDTTRKRLLFDTLPSGSSPIDFYQLGANARARVIANQHGWLGFGLDCRDCAPDNDAAGLRIWRFPTFPKIVAIDADGPAQAAGMMAGDVLRAIDGVSITTSPGATRFSGLRPGDKVRLTVDRNGKKVDLVMTVAKVN